MRHHSTHSDAAAVVGTARLPIEPLEQRLLFSTLIVDDSAPGVVQDGTSWGTAYLTLQQAITAASDGDTILVGQGTYYPTTGISRTISFSLKSGVTVLGGYEGYGSGNDYARDVAQYPTILSGDIGTPGSNSDNSYHVVTAVNVAATTILDGFTISDGNADLIGHADRGGGLLISGLPSNPSTPTIRNCTFKNNTAYDSGGGVQVTNGAPTLSNCTFVSNTAHNYGGGMGVLNSNEASPLTLTNCRFIANSMVEPQGIGGALYSDASTISLSGCSFTANSASAGAGIFSQASTVAATDCHFTQNSASGGAGIAAAFSTLTVTRCDFTANSATRGAAIDTEQFNSSTIIDCNFTDNTITTDDGFAGGITSLVDTSLVITHCAFTRNSNSALEIYDTTCTIDRCTFTENSDDRYLSTGEPTGSGGAANLSGDSPITVSRCTFTRNRASFAGGAIFDATTDFNLTVTDCLFNGNSAYGAGAKGGGILLGTGSATFVNCTVTGNTAEQGGGVYASGDVDTLTLTNCTLAENVASEGGGLLNRSLTAITNSIFWGNSATTQPQIYDKFGGSSTVAYSDVQDTLWPGTGNISADPVFVRVPDPGGDLNWGTPDDDYGNLRLKATSPALDAGDNSAVPAGVTSDLAGRPRFTDIPNVHDPGAIVDMGAYERALPGFGLLDWTLLRDAPRFTLAATFTSPLDFTSMTSSTLGLLNLSTGQTVNTGSFSVLDHSDASSAQWSFTSLLPDGNYRATIPADSLTSSDGDPLAADVSFDFFSLSGDANSDRSVDLTDFTILAANFNTTGKPFSQGNFDYDAGGSVDLTDFTILAANFNKSLPPIAAPAGAVALAMTQPGTLAAPAGDVAAAVPSSARSSLAQRLDLLSSPRE